MNQQCHCYDDLSRKLSGTSRAFLETVVAEFRTSGGADKMISLAPDTQQAIANVLESLLEAPNLIRRATVPFIRPGEFCTPECLARAVAMMRKSTRKKPRTRKIRK